MLQTQDASPRGSGRRQCNFELAEIRARSWKGATIGAEVAELAADLIRIPSLSGTEHQALEYLEGFFRALNWNPERIPIPGSDRHNLFVTFGSPRTVFTAHCDVVPGPEALFSPRLQDGMLIGRGACDVKGALSAMIAAAHNLSSREETGFGLLVVVGEEFDGIGAKIAGRALAQRGISYIVNAEPTEGKLALGHTGVVAVELEFRGTACHSGYPECGDDANLKALRAALALMSSDYGRDPILGEPVRTIGKFSGGTVPNQVSARASVTFSVRSVHNDVDWVLSKIQEAAVDATGLRLIRAMPCGKMIAVPGFETCIVRYGTDIPHLLEGLSAEALLYGPGSIHNAHTDCEHVRVAELTDAISGYMRIFHELKKRPPQNYAEFRGPYNRALF